MFTQTHMHRLHTLLYKFIYKCKYTYKKKVEWEEGVLRHCISRLKTSLSFLQSNFHVLLPTYLLYQYGPSPADTSLDVYHAVACGFMAQLVKIRSILPAINAQTF